MADRLETNAFLPHKFPGPPERAPWRYVPEFCDGLPNDPMADAAEALPEVLDRIEQRRKARGLTAS
jgi:hypothetical protein